jgi:uncharacterized protein YdhG (YjbR/CyaY superfamily)
MKAATANPGSATDVDDYLASLLPEAQATLEKLRKAIRAAAPAATEAFSFDRPAFMLNGKRLVQYWASKGHCSLYIMTPAFVKAHAEDLAGYDASGATIRFPANKPMPAALVKKLIKDLVAESGARANKTKAAK